MRRGSAVSVDDNLAAGQARVAIGAANEEFAGRIDVPDGVGGDPLRRQRLADIGFDDAANVLGREALVDMLMREHDLRRLDRLAVGVTQRDLALGVGAEPLLLAAVAGAGELFQNLMRIIEWRRHSRT